MPFPNPAGLLFDASPKLSENLEIHSLVGSTCQE